jgi:hypothetical protein
VKSVIAKRATILLSSQSSPDRPSSICLAARIASASVSAWTTSEDLIWPEPSVRNSL